MLPQNPNMVGYRRWSGSVVLACVWLYVASGPALAIETAREIVRRDAAVTGAPVLRLLKTRWKGCQQPVEKFPPIVGMV
jgi:hypothetical protein